MGSKESYEVLVSQHIIYNYFQWSVNIKQGWRGVLAGGVMERVRWLDGVAPPGPAAARRGSRVPPPYHCHPHDVFFYINLSSKIQRNVTKINVAWGTVVAVQEGAARL